MDRTILNCSDPTMILNSVTPLLIEGRFVLHWTKQCLHGHQSAGEWPTEGEKTPPYFT